MKSLLILFLLGVTCQLVQANRCLANHECKPTHICINHQCVRGPQLKHHGHSLHSDPSKNFFGGARRLQACSTGADCGSQSVCVDGKCVVDNGHGGKCSVGAHCPNGYNCVNARCVKSSKLAEAKLQNAMFCSIFCKLCKNGVCLE